MRIEIKRVVGGDLETLTDWHREHAAINFPDSKYKKRMFFESLRKALASMQREQKEVLLKVMVDDEMAGWLWLKIVFDIYKDYYYCDLHYIHLAPEYRGRGLGKKLMIRADEWAKKSKAKEIRLGTATSNEASINLYLKMGYKIKRYLMEKKICRQKKK